MASHGMNPDQLRQLAAAIAREMRGGGSPAAVACGVSSSSAASTHTLSPGPVVSAAALADSARTPRSDFSASSARFSSSLAMSAP